MGYCDVCRVEDDEISGLPEHTRDCWKLDPRLDLIRGIVETHYACLGLPSCVARYQVDHEGNCPARWARKAVDSMIVLLKEMGETEIGQPWRLAGRAKIPNPRL